MTQFRTFPSAAQVTDYRARYNGRTIRFIDHGEPDPAPLTPGLIGTSASVDDGGILHVKWSDGRTLGLVIGVDRFEVVRVFPDRGNRSPRYGHLGMWNLGLGPNSPLPSQRLEVAILDENGAIVRRFEQVRGACTDPGYVDFFLSHNCRPARHLHPVVDIDANGKCANIIFEHYSASMGMGPYLEAIGSWAVNHGKPEWAIPENVKAKDVQVIG